MDERKVLCELIELYRDSPCLWDTSNEDYKDNNKKRISWEILVIKYKELEPDANVASVKRKIDNLKYSYKREVAKVKASKASGCGSGEVHKPNLWYFDLMTFLEKKTKDERRGVDTISSDDESPPLVLQAVKRKGNRDLDKKSETLLDTTNNLPQQTRNEYSSFGIYVGEALEALSTLQRQIAEKLISDVIFLAKTGNLNFDSKLTTGVQIPFIPQYTYSPSKLISNNTTPRYTNFPSIIIRDNNNTTPAYYSDSSSSSLPVLSSPESSDPLSLTQTVPRTSQTIQQNENSSQRILEGPAGSLLKKLLTFKNSTNK